MSLRQSMRTCRPAVNGLARRVPAARAYSSKPPQPPHTRPVNLLGLAAGGAVVGFVGAIAGGYFNRPAGKAKLDGVPNITVIETHGQDWEPEHALEKDDPKVCLGEFGHGMGIGAAASASRSAGAGASTDVTNVNVGLDNLGLGLSFSLGGFCLMLRNPMRIRMATWVTNLQDHIVKTMEGLEASAPPDGEHASGTFLRDHWIRPSGGEGSSCVLQGGRVFEKAGVNVSIVEGKLTKGAQMQMRADHDSIKVSDEPLPYFATGLSIVLHPRNPHAPTVHLNYRYFELCDNDGNPVAWWFGGGTDLTPNYLYPEDATHFHDTIKGACDKHNPAYYPAFKEWCDKYFYLPHRGETRGVGGIFFDDLTTSTAINGDKQPSREEVFEFVKSASSAFLPAYVPLVARRMNQTYTEHERQWQLVRRGRYVEFNLLYDRGTKFGLNIPGARVESILMSLPEVARWEYMCPIGADGSGSREEVLQKVLKNPKWWASDAKPQ